MPYFNWWRQARMAPIVGVLALALVAAACAGSTAPSPTAAPAPAAKTGATAAPTAAAPAPAAPTAGAAAKAAPGKLVVATFGGAGGQNWKKWVIDTFAASTGGEAEQMLAVSGDLLAKLRQSPGNPPADVGMMGDEVAARAVLDGLVEPLQAAKVPNLANLYPQARIANDMGAHIYWARIGIIYNTKRISSPPQSWRDLWNTQVFKKVGIPDITNPVGIRLLILAAQLNGGSLDNMDPGFNAMKQLNPQVIQADFQVLLQQLSRGELDAIVQTDDLALAFQKEGASVEFVVPSEGALTYSARIIVPKGTKNVDRAMQYVNWALDEKQLKAMAENQFLSPVNKNVKVSPEVAKNLLYGQEAVDKAKFFPAERIAQNLDAWTEKWKRTVLQ